MAFGSIFDFSHSAQEMWNDSDPTLLFTLGAIILAALFFARSRRGEGGDGGAPPGQGEAIAPRGRPPPPHDRPPRKVLAEIARAEASRRHPPRVPHPTPPTPPQPPARRAHAPPPPSPPPPSPPPSPPPPPFPPPAPVEAARGRHGEGGDGGAPPGQGEAIAPVMTEAQRKVLEAIAQAGAGATSVDLSSAGIGDAGATQMAGMLRENETVTTMHLRHNQIGDEGARALADGLRENATVTTMSLWCNHIGDEGARA